MTRGFFELLILLKIILYSKYESRRKGGDMKAICALISSHHKSAALTALLIS